MTALPNQVKDTWDVNMDMTSTFTCGYGYIKWRNVTKEDELCPSGDAYTSIDFPLFRTADAYLMAAEAILRGANGTQSEALGYVNEVRTRAYMSGKYAKTACVPMCPVKLRPMNLIWTFCWLNVRKNWLLN